MSLSSQLRKAMLEFVAQNQGSSINQLSKACKIAQASLSRFASGSELRSASMDKLAEFLELELTPRSAAPKKSALKKSPKGK
jgi:predicted XRE-type DNA-binding protein